VDVIAQPIQPAFGFVFGIDIERENQALIDRDLFCHRSTLEKRLRYGRAATQCRATVHGR
jgi:hypothetical protein